MPKYKVVVTDAKFPSYDIERSLLEPGGAELEVHRCTSSDEVLEVAHDADALLVTAVPITRDVIAGLTRCKGIVRYGVGYDVVDVDAAREHGIPVVNVPDYCTAEVADHTMTLILALVRKLPQVSARVRRGEWAGAPCRPIHTLEGRTLGLLGIGRIGRAVIERARPFGFALQAYDPYTDDATFAELGVKRLDLDALLETSNVLSLHAPLTPDTHHVLGAAAIARMQPGSFLVNVARGGLIDEQALEQALRSGHLAGAALDVFEHEPVPADASLLEVESLIATSHCAWYAEEAFDRLHRFAAEEVVRLLRGEPARNVVNAV